MPLGWSMSSPTRGHPATVGGPVCRARAAGADPFKQLRHLLVTTSVAGAQPDPLRGHCRRLVGHRFGSEPRLRAPLDGGGPVGRNLGGDLARSSPQRLLGATNTNSLNSRFTSSRRSANKPDLVRDEEVAGSNPVTPTTRCPGQRLNCEPMTRAFVVSRSSEWRSVTVTERLTSGRRPAPVPGPLRESAISMVQTALTCMALMNASSAACAREGWWIALAACRACSAETRAWSCTGPE
jgi:hypothetical protein